MLSRLARRPVLSRRRRLRRLQAAQRRVHCRDRGDSPLMANLRPRGSSVFSGLVLIFIGLLLLLHNYRGFELTGIILHWWPLILIFWGAIKIYERTAGARGSQPGASRITT